MSDGLFLCFDLFHDLLYFHAIALVFRQLIFELRHFLVECLAKSLQLFKAILVYFREDGSLILDTLSELLQIFDFAVALARLVCSVCECVALWVLLHLEFVPLFEFAKGVATIFAKVELCKVDAMTSEEALILHPEIFLGFLTFVLINDSLSQHALSVIAPVPLQIREEVRLLVFCRRAYFFF